MKASIYFRKISRGIGNIAMVLISLMMIYPLIWMFYSAFKEKSDFNVNVLGLPKKIVFDNFVKAIEVSHMDEYFMNSVIFSVATVALVIVFGFIAGYILARYQFKGKGILKAIFLVGMLIPIYSLLIPVYIEFDALGIYGSRLSIIIAYTGINLSLTIFLIESFVSSIPVEMEEYAYLSGCSPVRAMFQIIMPLCGPVISTSIILTFLAAWNEFAFALVLINDPSMKTIPLGMSFFVGEYSTNYPGMMAASVIATLPVLILYFICSKRIIEGMTAGAVKG